MLYLLISSYSYAQDSRNDYQVEYFLNKNGNQLQTKVSFDIKITNLRSDVYVKQFTLSFPSSFLIHNINAADDHITLTPTIATKNNLTNITLQFSNPTTGRNSVNNFHLEFNQDNLFVVNGNIWEVIIPTIEDRKDSSYKIVVDLPENNNKKISIAKPIPDTIAGNQIIWNNPSEKTVYAVFGNEQFYKTSLTYHLKNDQIIPVYTDIAFPPDTLYQKIYLDKISPVPNQIFQDEDGNLLGRYILGPGSKKNVIFTGTIAVFSQPRDELLPIIARNFLQSKKYLLSPEKYWNITNQSKINGISTNLKDVYDFVVKKLHYNYQKINSNKKRLGADLTLDNTSQAVCMEFTDLFIAITREKGIYSREIEGYGFSQNTNLRPLSLVSDILHSWPEYFDIKKNFWIPLDPTWENTSGIDYFSSFDLNHIVFAIHGMNSEYPLPAGAYKFEDSKDVNISATQSLPKETINLSVGNVSFPKKINDQDLYQTKLVLKNNGDTYIWNKNITISTTGLVIMPSTLLIDSLAPYEEKTFVFSYRLDKSNKSNLAGLTITLPSGKQMKAQFAVVSYYYDLGLKLSLIILVISTLILYFINKKRNARH